MLSCEKYGNFYTRVMHFLQCWLSYPRTNGKKSISFLNWLNSYNISGERFSLIFMVKIEDIYKSNCAKSQINFMLISVNQCSKSINVSSNYVIQSETSIFCSFLHTLFLNSKEWFTNSQYFHCCSFEHIYIVIIPE